MRRWLVLVMIVLLPLRGWAGDLMSVQMVAGAAHESVAMSPDCPMQSSATSDMSDIRSGDMKSCSSCELCIPLAELANVRLEVMGFASHEKPAAGGTSFISALPALALKPPIS